MYPGWPVPGQRGPFMSNVDCRLALSGNGDLTRGKWAADALR